MPAGLPAYLLSCFHEIVHYSLLIVCCVFVTLSRFLCTRRHPAHSVFVPMTLHPSSTTVRPAGFWDRIAAGPLLFVFGIVSFRYCITGMIAFLRHCNTDSGSFQWDVDWKLDWGSLSDSPETGEDSSRCCSWWIPLLIGRTNYSRRSCANK